MKKNKSKIIIIFITILYVVVSGGFLFFFFSKNDLGLNEVGNYYLINSGNIEKNNIYQKGSLVVVEKTDIKKLKKNDQVILHKNIIYEKNGLFVLSTVDKIKDDYFTIKNDNYHWNNKSIVGKVKNTYSNVGYIITLFDSGLLFFMLLFVPVCIMFIYEVIYAFSSSRKKNNIDENNKKNNELNNQDAPVEKTNVYSSNIESSEVEESIASDEKTDANEVGDSVQQVYSAPRIIVPNIDLTDEELQSDNIESLVENKLSSIVIKNGNLSEEEENDDTNTGDINDDSSSVEENTTETENNEPVVIGKGIKNFTLKILELKKYEVFDIINILNNARNNISVPEEILKNIISSYVSDKYLEPIDYSEYDFKNKEQILIEKINHYTDKKRVLDMKQKNEIIELLLFYNGLDNNYSNLGETIDKFIKFDSDLDKKIFINFINEKKANYDKLMNKFSDKISSTKVFNLITSKTAIDNVFNTQIKSNIKFSKMFSEYIIDKSYEHSIVMENLEEVLLKLVSALLIKELFEFNYVNRYIIYFNESLYSKEEKLNEFIDNFDDTFSQKKILILIDRECIKKYKNKLEKLKNKGFNFIIQINKSDLMDAEFDKNNLALGEYLIVVGDMVESEKKTLIPSNLLPNTYCVFDALDTEVIKQ